MKTEDLATLPIEVLAPRLRKREFSVTELFDSVMARIARFDPSLRAYREIAQSARTVAQDLDREFLAGGCRGPLHGIPIAVKDNYLTADMPTRLGVDLPIETFPCRDAEVVSRLRKAGAIIIGKTQMHGFAWGVETPLARNPWNLDCVSGGSSGGSAVAAAAALCSAALGTDTGGSVRIPASLCGCVGMKPTAGLVSKDGIVTHSWSLDVAGSLSRTVGDAAIILEALTGQCRIEGATAPTDKFRIGYCPAHFFDRNALEVQNIVNVAIDYLANRHGDVIEIELPHLKYGLGSILAIELVSCNAGHAELLYRGLQDQLPTDVRDMLELGAFVSGADYLRAEQVRRLIMEDFKSAFEQVDVVVSPTVPMVAWPVGQTSVRISEEKSHDTESILSAAWRLTYPFNLAGLPAITIPCGFDAQALPIGLQFAAKPFAEQTLLTVAQDYERAHGWSDCQPRLL